MSRHATPTPGRLARRTTAAAFAAAAAAAVLVAACPGGGTDAGTDAGGGGTDGGAGGVCEGVTPAKGLPPLGVQVVGSFSYPVGMVAPAGDTTRLFVVEQPGAIRVVDLSNDTVLPVPFLDVDPLVGGPAFPGDERGLLGLAFHPGYAVNGRFFVYYTDSAGDQVIAEYARDGANPDVATATATAIVLTIPDFAGNHNGGQLAFGPDGLLYIGSGDGGGAGDPNESGQDTSVLLGKILRIDVDGAPPYAVPPANPFAAGGGAPEILAYGFRNPWRFSFDVGVGAGGVGGGGDGALYVGDVGQSAWEEIDVIEGPDYGPGGNYGWDDCEGTADYEGTCAGSLPPVTTYSHTEGCSVTGGFVYRGCAMPGWHGRYFYGDYCGGWVRSFVWAGGAASDAMEHAGLQLPMYSISSFGVDARGELYVADLGSGGAGTVYRVVPL